ncbi:hypothetical protein [Massilia cavernae]|nr:hypothetical protein [Massilia cavernae]
MPTFMVSAAATRDSVSRGGLPIERASRKAMMAVSTQWRTAYMPGIWFR